MFEKQAKKMQLGDNSKKQCPYHSRKRRRQTLEDLRRWVGDVEGTVAATERGKKRRDRVAPKRVLKVEGPSATTSPQSGRKGLATSPEPGGRITSPGSRSVRFQFIYVFYPQRGINDCETDLIFMSTLRPSLI